MKLNVGILHEKYEIVRQLIVYTSSYFYVIKNNEDDNLFKFQEVLRYKDSFKKERVSLNKKEIEYDTKIKIKDSRFVKINMHNFSREYSNSR